VYSPIVNRTAEPIPRMKMKVLSEGDIANNESSRLADSISLNKE